MNENCAKKYSHYFNNTLKEVFRMYGKPIPYILELLEENCEDTECTHHVFSIAKDFHSNNGAVAIPKDTEWTLQCHRCMCLLDLVEKQISDIDIAEAFGISRQSINQIVKQGLEKLKKRNKKEEVTYGTSRSEV